MSLHTIQQYLDKQLDRTFAMEQTLRTIVDHLVGPENEKLPGPPTSVSETPIGILNQLNDRIGVLEWTLNEFEYQLRRIHQALNEDK